MGDFSVKDDPLVQELIKLAAELGVTTCFTPFTIVKVRPEVAEKWTKDMSVKKHDDEKEDRALIKKMVKKGDLKELPKTRKSKGKYDK